MAGQSGRKYINHKLNRVDTLVSLALKYNVTVQDLKTENKIWNNDHLFLRETILIPLTSENEATLDENDIIVVFDGTSSHTSSPSSSHSHLPNGEDAGSASSSPAAAQHSEASTSSTVKARSMSTPSDFFSKYDTNIAQLKGDVAKMEQNAASLEEIVDSNPLSQQRGSESSYPSTNSSSQHREHSMPDKDSNDSALSHVRPLSSNKQIKSAMENLEQISDDIYEL